MEVCFLRCKGVQLFMWPAKETGKAKPLCGFAGDVLVVFKTLSKLFCFFPDLSLSIYVIKAY